jgi:hypothetical protein
MWSSLRRIWSGGGVAYLAKAIGNTLHTVGTMSQSGLTAGCANWSAIPRAPSPARRNAVPKKKEIGKNTDLPDTLSKNDVIG